MSSEENNEKTEDAPTNQETSRSTRRSSIMAPTGRGHDAPSRGSDFAAKPGFRSASNKRSKASKKKRRKK